VALKTWTQSEKVEHIDAFFFARGTSPSRGLSRPATIPKSQAAVMTPSAAARRRLAGGCSTTAEAPRGATRPGGALPPNFAGDLLQPGRARVPGGIQ